MTSFPPRIRFVWVDLVKGISILWIAFFHFFEALPKGTFPSPLDPSNFFPAFLARCAPSSAFGAVGCVAEALFVAIARVGFHAVGVFLVLSGFGLTYSAARPDRSPEGWGRWYRNRLVRLFPMYWVAHLVYLVSPFVARYEAIDYRFLLSALGDRIYPIESIFYYFNAALWYFGLLLQLYLVYPLLYGLLQKLGRARFLILCGVVTAAARYTMLCVVPVNGYWVQGGFFAARLWEFALGMTLGHLYRESPETAERRLFSPLSLFAGGAIYLAGLHTYDDLQLYTFTDAATGTGLFLVLAHLARAVEGARGLAEPIVRIGIYSYGLYLIHQPYVLYVGQLAASRVGLAVYVGIGFAVVALLAILCIPLERSVNRLVDRILG